jgi:hypothetical protein
MCVRQDMGEGRDVTIGRQGIPVRGSLLKRGASLAHLPNGRVNAHRAFMYFPRSALAQKLAAPLQQQRQRI